MEVKLPLVESSSPVEGPAAGDDTIIILCTQADHMPSKQVRQNTTSLPDQSRSYQSCVPGSNPEVI